MVSIWFLPALFHAIAAGVQQALRKQLLSVASTFQLGSLLFSFAGLMLLGVHYVSTGSLWFPNVPTEFWWAMMLFVVANSVAVILSLQVLSAAQLSQAMVIIVLSGGMMILGDWMWFKKLPHLMGWVGIFCLLFSAFIFIKTSNGKAGEKTKKILLIKQFAAVGIYNYVTPVTNKYCAIVTNATFSSATAHILIGITLFIAYGILCMRGKAKWTLNHGNMSVRKFWIGIAVIAFFTAASNGLLSWSFQMGASIPGALLMKRTIPPIIAFFIAMYMERNSEAKMTPRIAFSMALSSIGAVMVATQ